MEKPQKVELHIGKHRVAVNFFITPDPTQKDHPFLFGMKWPHKLTYVSANHIPTKKSLKATLAKDKRTIKIQYPFSAKQASRLITKIKIEIDPQYISKMGNLNILEWPDKNLERIVFHKDSGPIFFSSVPSPPRRDPSTGQTIIKPRQYLTKIQSHFRTVKEKTTAQGRSFSPSFPFNKSPIRFEWGKPPKIKIKYKYLIKNKSPFPARNLVVIGTINPTTNFQKTTLLSNIPTDVDNDGNLMVGFRIKEIEGQGTFEKEFFIDVMPRGNKHIGNISFGTWEEYRSVTDNGNWGSRFLEPSNFWPISHPKIQTITNNLKKQAAGASEFVKNTFIFVNNTLSYQKDRVRNDALQALQTRRGDCSEYADLFICILRAGGIPAKYIMGDILDFKTQTLEGHAWCEIYAPRLGWIQCDPTWGFLTGVSCQHLARQREGINLGKPNIQIRFKGQFGQRPRLEVKETRSVRMIHLNKEK